MKARTLKDMQKEVQREVDRQNAEYQYEIYTKCVDDMFKGAAAAMVAVLHRRGRSKAYIQKFFDEFIGILEYPDVFGKALTTTELFELFTKEYGLDFNRIHVRCETLEEYKRRNKIR